MIVLGVDPGLRVAGYSVIAVQGRRHSVLDYGAITLPQQTSVAHRVGLFYDRINALIKQWGVTVISLETPFLGKNAQNFLKLGYVRGALFLLSYQHDVVLHEFSPRSVKQAITGFGGAGKDQVARMVYWLCPQVNHVSHSDVTDALAVSLCACFFYM